MTRLPQVNGARLLRALAKAGFVELHRKGSHVMVAHRDDPSRLAVIPIHKGTDLPPGTVRAILKGCRLSAEKLRSLL